MLFSFLLFWHLTSFKFNIAFDTRLKTIIHTRDKQRECIHTLHEQFWHKLNNFSFRRIFEKKFKKKLLVPKFL
jgi:hypothetical protein